MSILKPQPDFLILDFETLSHVPWEAPIVSWGAICGKWTDSVNDLRTSGFYKIIDVKGQRGRKPSQQTIDWWKKQSNEAKAVLVDPNKIKIEVALSAFKEYCLAMGVTKDTHIWIRAPQFDAIILESIYYSYDMECPLQPWRIRDTRTACDILYNSKNGYAPNTQMVFDREGIIAHNALDDCLKEFLQIRPYFLNRLKSSQNADAN